MVANTTSIIFQTIFTILNITAEQEDSSSYNYYFLNLGQQPTAATRCYGMYGCFELTPPWTSEHRPVSLFPESILKVEPKLTYFSREDPVKGTRFDLNDHDTIRTSKMDTTLPVFTITHGFNENGNHPWVKKMTKELLTRQNCNVIVIDWGGGSGPPYAQAVANIRLVGAIVGHFLADLAQYTNSSLEHVHCIGHSLGAHLSGYIGYTVQDEYNLTLGRITGMDPAEPHFAKADRPVRLDKSAAKFVDIIHTDASQFIRGGLGMTESIGHVDFFPNGGTDQPGCGKSLVEFTVENGGSFFNGIKKFLSCNHVRSHQYFSESINTKCRFQSISCQSYEAFVAGKCVNCMAPKATCIKFGFDSREDYERLVKKKVLRKNQSLVQYLRTADEAPFCKAHYKISVKISDSSESKTHGGEVGQLWFVIHETTDKSGWKSNRVPLNPGGYHEPGATYTEIVSADEVSHLKGVEVEWDYHHNFFNPLTWRILASPRLHVAHIDIESLETGKRVSACPKNKKNPLITGIPQMMLPSYC